MNISLKQYKKDFTYSYTIGVFATLELLRYRLGEVKSVYVSSRGEKNKGVQMIKEICKKNQIHTEISDGLITKISNTENNYAIGVFSKYQTTIKPSENHVVLVAPSDMGNLGTIIRTMTGFNVKNLALIRPAADIFNPKAIRASQGAIFQINFQYFSTFNKYKSSFNRKFYPFMLNGKITLENVKFTSPYSLIFGNEGSGLGKDYEQVGQPVSIPQRNSIDSLNVSIAVGIALYESFKQNK